MKWPSCVECGRCKAPRGHPVGGRRTRTLSSSVRLTYNCRDATRRWSATCPCVDPATIRANPSAQWFSNAGGMGDESSIYWLRDGAVNSPHVRVG